MASVTDIPELVKTMYSLFGEKWGKRIGRIIVLGILGGVLGGAVYGISAGIRTALTLAENLSPNASAILLSILAAIILAVGMASMAIALAILIGGTLRIGLATPIRRDIDSTLEQAETLLLSAKKGEIQDANIDELLSKLKLLRNQWEKSRLTRISNWLHRKKH